MTQMQSIPPSATFMQLLAGKWITQAISAAAHLGLADRLKDETKSCDELAQECNAHASTLYRLMRALSEVGLMKEYEGKKFSLTPVGACLRTDTTNSLAKIAIMFGEEWHNIAWAGLADSVRNDRGAFTTKYGTHLFDWLSKNPEAAQRFNDGMTSISTVASEAITSSYDFSGFSCIADIGGGHGYLLSRILQASPKSRGILFDLPQVTEGSKNVLSNAGVIQRCEVMSGDFFTSVPTGCDAYILKHIIHDWNDEDCIKILKNCAKGLNPNGKILVADGVVPPLGTASFHKWLDLEMLVMTNGGRERTELEFRELFAKAGLSLNRIIPTPSMVNILEATRVK